MDTALNIDKSTIIEQLEGKLRVDLCYLPDEHKADRDIALAAIARDGFNLHYFPLFNNDKEIVKIAVSMKGSALLYASEAMKDDREIVVHALHQTQQAYHYISQRLRKDISLAMSAVLRDGLLLYYAEESLKDEESVVLAAVKQNGNALEYVSDRLKNIPYIVEAAIKKNGEALLYAPDIFKNDITYIKMALQVNGNLIDFYPQYRDNKEIALLAVGAHGNSISFLSSRLKNDARIAYIAYCNDDSNFYRIGRQLAKQINNAKQNGVNIKEYLRLAADAQDLREALENDSSNNKSVKRRKI